MEIFEIASKRKYDVSPDDIAWSKDYLLTWNDFQGLTKETQETREKSIKAISRTGLNFELHPRLITNKNRKKFQIKKIVVKAVFHKKKSWVKLKEIKQGWETILLKHEQGHFDTSQMFADEARKRLETFVKNKSFTIVGNTVEELEKKADEKSIKITKEIAAQILKDLKKLQDKYDEDTKHGSVLEKQKEYDQKFDSLRE